VSARRVRRTPPRTATKKRRSRARASAMRVGIACYPTFGGSGIVATELGRRLAARGHEVHFISLALPYRQVPFSSRIYFHEVVVEPYPLFQTYTPLSLALAAKMSEVAENHELDLLHVHYVLPFAASAYLARELAKPRYLPVVTTLHGTDITVVGQQPAFHRLTKFSIESSDRVTAVSRYLKERTIESLGITRPIEVIYNFVDPKRFAPRRSRASWLAPADVPVLMHASNFRPVKNLETLIRVFARVRQERACRLVLVGDGPEKANAEALCRRLRVERHAIFLGNQDLMEELLPMADVFLLPSRQESFGLAALEAMSAGVPVVASNIGGLPELVADGHTGFLHDPDDVEGQAASVLRLLHDRALHARMGRAARRVARERFSVEDAVDRYELVYREVTRARR
jgi:N-acetyl-alpha-D-glucosaminyl L-malate synthase BshA